MYFSHSFFAPFINFLGWYQFICIQDLSSMPLYYLEHDQLYYCRLDRYSACTIFHSNSYITISTFNAKHTTSPVMFRPYWGLSQADMNNNLGVLVTNTLFWTWQMSSLLAKAYTSLNLIGCILLIR